MKINVISDIHASVNHSIDAQGQVEWLGFEPEKLKPADYLVVAGDLSTGASYRLVLDELRKKTHGMFKDIIWCKGNHDYWLSDISSSPRNDHRTSFADGDVAFVASTMWTPILESERSAVVSCMNDFLYIRRFGVNVQRYLFEQSLDWMTRQVDLYKSSGKKVVMITHHNPFPEMIPDEFSWSGINSAYAVMGSWCDEVCPDVWICGHTHVRYDKVLIKNGCKVRCIRNPIGYRSDDGMPSEVDPEHWYDCIIEV